jgi:enterochelin esterase-like enzyme
MTGNRRPLIGIDRAAALGFAIAALIPAARSQGVASPRISRLQQSVAAGDAAALPAFWDEVHRDGEPLIEPCDDASSHLVTFLWRSEADTHVVLLADFTDSVQHMTLNRLPGTDVWFRSYTFEDDERFLYELSVDDPAWPFADGDKLKYPSAPRPDPLNPHVYDDAKPTILSLVELPAAPKLLPTTPDPAVPHVAVGRFQPLLHSDILGNDRKLFLYRPTGYDDAHAPYPLLIFGSSYISQTRLPLILDDLIAARRIPPVVAIFIDFPPGVQDEESGGGAKFGDFVARELLPWVRERVHVTDDPRRVIIGGASAGGHSAACVALQHPEAIGNVIAQSGAFWRGLGNTAAYWSDPAHAEGREGVLQLVQSRPAAAVRFRLAVGRLEYGTAFDPGRVSMLDASQRLRDALAAKGYDATLVETGGGHDPYDWESSLPDALVSLLGAP